MTVPIDIVGGTFWLLSMAMIGSSVFFLLERNNVDSKWHTTMVLLSVVMLIAAIYYYFMKQLWMVDGVAPIITRYSDWVLTQPAQLILFFTLLSAVTTTSAALFWRLLIGALVMVLGQFLGAAGYMSATLGFIIGLLGWLYILGELYMGVIGQANHNDDHEVIDRSFRGMRLIVTIGWAIYPLGYFLNTLGGGVDINSLNLVYNLADILNKLIYGFVIYSVIIKDKTITHT